ncbi:MAG TPA: polyamine ABC transporter substrate-binding protein [Roseomonas sp.]|nr:polyamine ABC transporter substrate-binding protein [Roseomonas sp.]
MLRRPLAAALCAAALLLAAPLPARAEEAVLNVYNWSDYIDPAALERFQKETGIQVRYDVFDSVETLEGKLSAGRSGYDVIVPTSEPTFSRLVRAGALKPLDRTKIPNWGNQDPTLLRQVESSDPGNQHGAIYLYGTVGLGIRADKVRELLPDTPLDSLDLLLKPENAKRLASCGIAVMDSATDVLPSVLHWLGRSPDSSDSADLQAAGEALQAIRPHIRAIIASGNILDALATGEYCVAMTYSGDVIQAKARADEAKQGVQLRYVLPKKGAQLWFDMLAIPTDAPHPEAAHRFINFLLQPEVMGGITNAVHYPNAIPAATPMVDAAVREDPNVYPTPEMLARTFTVRALSPQAERARSRLWNRFKAGH